MSLSYLTLDHLFTGLTICNPDKVISNQNLIVKDGVFRFPEKSSLGKDSKSRRAKEKVELNNWVVIPGFVNGHDHLLGNYLPKVGNGPYLNWLPWDRDLKAAEVYNERARLTPYMTYQLGYYRQILSGATTVCDHIPHQVNEGFIEDSYVRVIDQYCLAHEISSYELPWGDGPAIEIARAKEKNQPFITHICEGFDPESLRGIEQLDELDGVFENTVLVHGISCSKKDVALIAKKKASMVWCPVSNYFMFSETLNLKEFIDQKVNLCLGTDSPMSGGMNILEEMKFAQKVYKKLLGKEIDPQFLFQMVTSNPSKAFKLDHKVGSISHDKSADLVLVRKHKFFDDDPYGKIVNMSVKDIELVVRDGLVLLIKEELLDLFGYEKNEAFYNSYQKVKVRANNRIVELYLIARPLDLKQEINRRVGFNKHLKFFPIEN